MADALSVELKALTKQFGSILANDHVDLAVQAGSIHALLGENGAGKSTVMCLLAGVYRPTSGEIFLHGSPAAISSPRDAVRRGVGMVFQNFRLVPTLTAAENIILGETHPLWRTRAWMSRKSEEIRTLAAQLGLPFEPHRPLWQLSVGEQQRVEIVKTLYRGADIILLDEPTSVLTPGEADQLFETLRTLKAQGKTIILTTHKLKEVMAVCDRISVMRKGKTQATLEASATDEREVARLMVGQDRQAPRPRSNRACGPLQLRLDQLTVEADHGRRALDSVSLDVYEGEIVGIAGVAGNGQRELAEVLAGLRSWQGGRVSFRDEVWRTASVRQSIRAGIGHIPENRMRHGLAGSLGSVDNLLFKAYRNADRSRFGFLRTVGNRLWSQKLVEQFDVRTAHLDAPVHQMSGGNQQKLLFAREIHHQPHLMIAVHPTQGLDVSAADGVHNLLISLRDENRSVLLISEDLDELLLLSDRIYVLFAGQVMGEVSHDKADREALGLMMAGVSTKETV